MIRIFLAIITGCFFKPLFGQINLVPNPSFENTVNCPNIPSISQSVGWLSFTQSPDYFHSCAPGNTFNAPNTFAGYQMPFHGQAFAGSVVNSLPLTPNAREYFGIQLLSPLTVGMKYYVSFYVSLADPPQNCWSNKIGARFTTYYFNGSQWNTSLITNFAHVKSDSLLKDTANWTNIAGSFTADSAYTYVVLGNFFNDSNTDTLNCANSMYT